MQRSQAVLWICHAQQASSNGVIRASEVMALGTTRLLIPRGVDPAHPPALSSASVCSSAGAYSTFSLFFLHPPTHRSTPPVSATVSEAPCPSYRNQGRSPFRRQTDEGFNDLQSPAFDDLQSLYEEERGRLNYSNRNSYGRTYPLQRSGRVGGSGGRTTREPSSYVPWRSRDVSKGESNVKYGKPWSSQDRNSSSWASQTEDEMHRGRWQQTMGDQRKRNLNLPSRDRERKSIAQQGSAYPGSENASRKREDSFSQRRGNGSYKESRNSPREREGSFARQGSLSRQDEQRPRQRHSWQGKGWESSWQGTYTENRSVTNGRSQRQYNEDVAREEFSSPSRNSSPWQSLKWQRENSQPSGSHDYPVAPWQSSFREEWESNEEKENGGEEVKAYGYTEANADLKGEQDQNRSTRTDVSPITRIIERLRCIDDVPSAQGLRGGTRDSQGRLADDLTLPSAKEYLSDRCMPQSSTEEAPKRQLDNRFPWEIEEVTREEDTTVERARRLRPLSAAELTISASELKRLRVLATHLKQRVKLGKRGVTTDLVRSIQQRFHTCEVVKVKCEGPPAGNMKKTLEALEQRTGGLVIWKAGSVAVLYRGKNFGQPVAEIVDDLLAKKLEMLMSTDGQELPSSVGVSGNEDEGVSQEDGTDESDKVGLVPDDDRNQANSGISLDDASKQAPRQRKKKLGPEFDKLEEYAMEVDYILNDLGPRFEEWIGPQPIPVDGDLLPEIIPDFCPPYRLLPFGVRPSISNTFATHLRRLSRPLAPHFVIGSDRGLQGLASAMVKLWENSEIAKIEIKRGILNTNQERIVEDLKQLTGGFFLCRDKKSMTFYRGNDFLPQAVSAALAERQSIAQALQDKEETGRLDRSLKVQQSIGKFDAKPSWLEFLVPEEQIRLKREAVKARRLQIVSHVERKITMALRKKEKAERELEKVEELVKPVGLSDDRETITDEERFMLRKLGLKMKAFLLLGRRGVFSGVVQNMHLHWKHRELVKIVVKEKDPVHLREMASMLECESGGILISIDPTSKGYAIIYYRGKNYRRPPQLRPPNLLTKRLALKRSVEIQRRLSLSKHIQTLEQEIVHLRAGLNKLNTCSLESSDQQVLNEEGANGGGSSRHCDASDNERSYIQSTVLNDKEQQEVVPTATEEDVDCSEDEGNMFISQISKQKLRRLCEMGPIFRAERLSKTERHAFRNEVLNLSKAAHNLVGRSNPLSTVAKAIRLHFLDHTFIKVGVRNRPLGTSVQDVAEELEDLTGGAVYAQDDYRIVLYRGWPTGEKMPLDELYDVLSPEQCDVLEQEEDDDNLDDGEDILKNGLIIDNAFTEYNENDSGEKNDDDVDLEDSGNVIKEGNGGLMLAATQDINMNYSSVEDEDDDSQQDRLSDSDTEHDEEDEGVDDDGLGWFGLSDGNAEEEAKTGDAVLIAQNFSDKLSENFPFVENIEGVNTEGFLRWDCSMVGDNDGEVAGGLSVSFDLDEDV